MTFPCGPTAMFAQHHVGRAVSASASASKSSSCAPCAAGAQQDGGRPLVVPAEIGDAQLRRIAAGKQAPGEREAGVVGVAGHHASVGQLQLTELLVDDRDRARERAPVLCGQGQQSGRIERHAPAKPSGEHVSTLTTR